MEKPYDKTFLEDPLKFYNPSNTNRYYANVPVGLYVETYSGVTDSDSAGTAGNSRLNISSVFIPGVKLIIKETFEDVPEDEDEGDKAFRLRRVLAKVVYDRESKSNYLQNGWKEF